MSSRTWDARAVDAPGGHVYQSMAWATHREASGWQPKFLFTQDGGAVLGLMRPWSGIPGRQRVHPARPGRRPASWTAPRLAARQVAAAHLLAAAGSDVVAADPEVPADMTGVPRTSSRPPASARSRRSSRHAIASRLPLGRRRGRGGRPRRGREVDPPTDPGRRA